jgi:DNA-binding response OmpR family regulator
MIELGQDADYSLLQYRLRLMPKILVIDDDEETRDLVTVCLEMEGHTVFSAKNADEGLAILSSVDPDLLVTDLALPGLDGVALIRHIRSAGSSTPNVPILVLTGFYMDMAYSALTNGADRALAKPTDPDTLIASVKSLLEHSSQGPAKFKSAH